MPEPLVIPIKIDAKGIEQELKNITEKLTFDFNLKVSGKGGGSKTSDYASQETTEKESIKISKEQLKNQEKEEKNREKENKQKEKEEKKRHKETVSIFKGVARGLGIGLGVSSIVGTARKIATESIEYGKTFANFATAKGITATELTNATKLFAGLGASEQEQVAMANYVLSAQQAYALRGEGPLKTNLYGRYAGLSAGLENLPLPDYLKEMNRYFQENLKNATPAQQREFLSSAFGSETAFGMELLKQSADELKEEMSKLKSQTDEAAEGARSFSKDFGKFWHNLKTDISNTFFEWYRFARQKDLSLPMATMFSTSAIISKSGSKRALSFMEHPSKWKKTRSDFDKKLNDIIFNTEENKDVYDTYDGLNYTPFNTEENETTFSSIGNEFLENQQTPIYDMINGSQTSIDASQNMTVIVNGNMTEDMLERTATEVGGMSYPNMSYFSGGVLK